MQRKRIIIIDDEPLISSLIKELVDEDTELEVSCITTAKDVFLDSIRHGSFDIALIDVSVGEREGGLNILRSFTENSIILPAIILSAHDETLYALKCLKGGARGYISKGCICNDLIRGLKSVMNGHLFVSGVRGKNILT